MYVRGGHIVQRQFEWEDAEDAHLTMVVCPAETWYGTNGRNNGIFNKSLSLC